MKFFPIDWSFGIVEEQWQSMLKKKSESQRKRVSEKDPENLYLRETKLDIFQ